jgi:hypothetical protein
MTVVRALQSRDPQKRLTWPHGASLPARRLIGVPKGVLVSLFNTNPHDCVVNWNWGDSLPKLQPSEKQDRFMGFLH